MSVADLAPMAPAAVSMRVINRRTVSKACTDGHWIHDISSALIVQGIMELLYLVEIVDSPTLSADTDDQYVWTLSASRPYNPRSAYMALFAGSVQKPLSAPIWGSWAPLKCKVFAWLAAAN